MLLVRLCRSSSCLLQQEGGRRQATALCLAATATPSVSVQQLKGEGVRLQI